MSDNPQYTYLLIYMAEATVSFVILYALNNKLDRKYNAPLFTVLMFSLVPPYGLVIYMITVVCMFFWMRISKGQQK